METQTNSMRLVDLVPQSDEITVPAGATAFFDGDCETFQFQGKLTNLGTLILSSSVNTELVVDALVNKGKVLCRSGNIALRTNLLDSEGEIESRDSLSVIAHPDRDLTVIARAGTFEAPSSILLQGDKNITVRGGSFYSSEIRFKSESGDLKIHANELRGPVYLKGANGQCGAKLGEVLIKQQCFSDDPLFYCTTGPITVDEQLDTPADFAVFAFGDITINGNVTTPKRLVLVAGADFEKPESPQFPNPGEDCSDENPAECDGCLLVAETVRPATITVNGNLSGDRVAVRAGGAITINGNVNGITEVQIDTNDIGTGALTVNGSITAGSLGASINGRHGSTTVTGDITSVGGIGMIGDSDDGNDLTVDGKIESSSEGIFISKKGKIELKKDVLSSRDLRIQNVKEDGETLVKGKIISSDGNVEVFTKGKTDIVSDPNTEISAKGFVKIVNDAGLNKEIKVGGKITAEEEEVEIRNEGNLDLMANEAEGQGEIKAGKFVKILIGEGQDGDGKITINGKVTAEDGEVDIKARGALEVKGDIKAEGNFVHLRTPDDQTSASGSETTIKTKKITAPGNNVVLTAGNKIFTETIDVSKVDGSNFAGTIDISANLAEGTTSDFIIGDTATDNGVKGKLIAKTDNGGNALPDRFVGGVRVFSKGSGNLRVLAEGNIDITASSSRNGILILDADAENNGQVLLPGGVLSVNGSGNNGAGAIFLLGQQVKAESGNKAILSSNHGDVDKLHFITIAAETLSYSSSGLEISANGDRGLVELLPKGAVEILSNMQPMDLEFEIVRPGGIDGTDGLVDITGSGTFDVNCNGSNCGILVSGNPVRLRSGDDVNFSSTGEENHSIGFSYTGQNQGAGGLFFSTNKQVSFVCNGTNDSEGGVFAVNMPKVVVDSTKQVRVEANGDSTGNGGLISITSSFGDFSMFDSRKLRLFADGGSSGSSGAGEGGIINLTAITPNAQMSLKDAVCQANGGAGKGGTITVNGFVVDFNAVTLQANAGVDGNGGQIFVNGTNSFNVKATLADDSRFVALGGSTTGNGGGVTCTSANDLAIQNVAIFDVSASGNGSGGILKLTANGSLLNLDDDAIVLRANAKGTGFGIGGLVELKVASSDGTVTSKADMRSTGSGTGRGGQVRIIGDNQGILNGVLSVVGSDTTPSQGGGSVEFNAVKSVLLNDLVVNAGGGNQGPGGTITLNAASADGSVNVQGQTQIVARGGSNGGFGGTVNAQTAGTIEIGPSAVVNISATGGNEFARDVTLSAGKAVVCEGKIFANGSGFREGGKVNITANGITLNGTAELRANAGATGGGFEQQIALVGTGQEPVSIDGTSKVFSLGGTTDGGGGRITVQNVGNIVVGPAAIINASAKETEPSPGNGNGGQAVIFSSAGTATVNGRVLANGSGNGNGDPDIGVQVGAQGIGLNNAILRSTGGANGKGGLVLFASSNGQSIDLTGTATVTARGGSSQGDGGTIKFLGTGDINVGPSCVINASARENEADTGAGKGGDVLFDLQNPAAGSLNLNATVRARAGDAGDGGTITVRSHQQLSIDGTKLNVAAAGNGVGGKIDILTDSIQPGTALVINGQLTAKGAGSGTGGTVNLRAPGMSIGSIVVDGGPTGTGGVIGIIGDQNLQLTNPATFSSRGGSSAGNGGPVVIVAGENLTIGSSVLIETIAPLGSGGTVSLEAGLASANGVLDVQGKIHTNGLQGNGGNISLKHKSTNEILVGASAELWALAPSGISGEISFENTNFGVTPNLKVRNAGSIRTPTSSIFFLQSGRPVEVTSVTGVLNGKVVSTGSDIKLDITQDDNLRLGNVNGGNGPVNIKLTGAGNIVRVDGTITGDSLVIETTSGNIGGGANPINTAVNSLDARTPVGSTGSVFIDNTANLLQLASGVSSGGIYEIKSSNDLTVGQIVSGGALRLFSNGAIVVGQPGSETQAVGPLTIQSGTVVTITNANRLSAKGNINISVGPIGINPACVQTTNTEPACAPANVDGTVAGGGRIFWGDGIVASGLVFVDTNTRTVRIVGNGSPINLQSCAINAEA